ncbi:MAG: hypothetical protein IKN72_10100 [Clostridia bacterium]|nr:hypothetical protein [Clostridia bacterium]
MQIQALDKNFVVSASDAAQTVYFDVARPPFTVHGLLRDAQGYYRVPHALAAETNIGVQWLNLNTAGGRVRFQTDADRVVLRAAMRSVTRMPHFAFTGSAGFDLYADDVYRGTFVPPEELKDGYTSELDLGTGGMREITVHFPLYSGVTRLELGLPAGSTLRQASAYRITAPVVYYGSSITQGGCASRPGNAYQNILSRLLSCDHLNLGFSGSAKGERCMAAYIAGLSMSAFVLDYDHNAPDPAYLEATHAAFFRTVRNKQPTLPIILLSRPQPNPNEDDLLRRDVVKRTWETAKQSGDQNVFFLDGTEMLRLFGGDSGTVDNCHPNDLGFYCMAKALEPVLRAVL